ncbi:MAG: acyl-CoA synthetase [Rhodospirillales bacterium]
MRALVWALLILVLLLIVALPTVLLLGFGMLPAIVALIIDRTEERSATFCVGGLNFCGVFPYLMELWFEDHDLGQAMHILTDVFALAVMYGGACMGWMLYLSLPPVIASFIQVMSERRLQQLRKTQKQILDEWGDEVIHDADLSDDGITPPQEAGQKVPAAA